MIIMNNEIEKLFHRVIPLETIKDIMNKSENKKRYMKKFRKEYNQRPDVKRLKKKYQKKYSQRQKKEKGLI